MTKDNRRGRAVILSLALPILFAACTDGSTSTTTSTGAGSSTGSSSAASTGAGGGGGAGSAGNGGSGGAGDPWMYIDITETLPPVTTNERHMEARAADLDADGDLDLVIAHEYGPNALLLNDGAAHFTDASERIPALVHDHEDIAVADLDADGDLDIVISAEDDEAKELFLNDGTAHFTDESARLPQIGKSNAVVAADIDADGDLDLVFGCDGQDVVFLNDGLGFFTDDTASRIPKSPSITQDVAAGDLDGDGDLDLVLGNEDGNGLLLNDGTGHFTDATDPRLPPPPNLFGETRNADLGDLDGDGDLDIYFSNVAFKFARDPQDRVLINNGQGFFTDETAQRIPMEKRWTTDTDLVDVDKDGDLDLVQAIVPEDSRYRLLLNDGSGVFTDQTEAAMPPTAMGDAIEVEAADFNGDGRLDLYFTGFMSADRLLLAK